MKASHRLFGLANMEASEPAIPERRMRLPDGGVIHPFTQSKGITSVNPPKELFLEKLCNRSLYGRWIARACKHGIALGSSNGSIDGLTRATIPMGPHEGRKRNIWE